MIFSVSEIDKIDFNEVLETAAQWLRLSVDGSKTFVKWDGDNVPTSVQNLTSQEGPYTYLEISSILSTSDWTSPMTEWP
jgi:hypothetical protein